MDNFSKIKPVASFRERGQRVILCADYNVPIAADKIADDTRIMASLRTIEYLLKLHSKIIIVSHRGRPAGRWDESLSLECVARRLAEVLHRKFLSLDEDRVRLPDYPVAHLFFVKTDLRKISAAFWDNFKPGDIAILENIRFYKGEEEQDEKFAKKIAAFGDAYVNEAFSASHHASATLSLLPKMLPAFAGFQLLEEIKNLSHVKTSFRPPLLLIVGGAKVTDKEKMLNELLPKAERVLVGGAMANLFLKLKDYPIGSSYVDNDSLNSARDLIRNFKEKIILPTDVVVARSVEGAGEVKSIAKVRPGEKIVDVGPKTILMYSPYIKKARTIIWNGPLGVLEKKAFTHGTFALARLVASRARGRAFVVVGGGETVEAMGKTGLKEHIDFVSTGGGAMLAFLGGEKLPGLEALK